MKNPSTTNTTHLTRILPALALLALAAPPSASAALTVFSASDGDFNDSADWSNLLPGQDGPANQQAVIQNLNRTATTSGDYTNADDPGTLLNDYSLVVRSDAILNIGHNLSTSASDTNTGIVYLGFDAGGGTINHTAGTLTTGSLNIGGFAANGTRTADYNISGTADIDANSIQIRGVDSTRRGRLLVGDGVSLDEAITIYSGQQGSIQGTGAGAGGTLTGQITLQSGADFRGNNMTLSGGIVSAANQGISINGNNWTIDTTAIDLGTGTLTLTSAGNNEANATELNVGGNDWGTARINFGGYLKLGVDNAMPVDAGVEFGWSTDGQSSGTLDLGGTDQTVAFLRQTTNYPTVNGDQNSTGGGTLTIDTAAGTYDYHGRITDGATATSLVKAGTGTQILDNNTGTASNYSGTTTINAGTLALVDASSTNNIASSSAIDVASGATLDVSGITNGFALANGQTLSGSGTVSGGMTVSLGSIISPGNSPGTMSTGAQTWEDGGTYLWEINDSGGSKGGDPGWDWLSITGTLELGSLGAGGFAIDIDSLAGAIAGDSAGFDTFAIDGYESPFDVDYSFVIATASGGINGFNADNFNLDFSGFSALNPEAGWHWEIIQDGANDLVLQAYAVPEPSSAALLGLGGLALMLRRKRSAA